MESEFGAITVFAILLLTLAAFIWGKYRHDVVALAALTALVISGSVPADEAFEGFAHPAVITVAAVLVVSAGLKHSGLIDAIGKLLSAVGKNLMLQVTALCAMVCIASAFMNNIGALAVLMPVAVQMARKGGHPPSLLLMPLAFSSLLGGMISLIGTPPNIIISSFREDAAGSTFAMFDFAPTGIGLSLVGLLFICTVGWRLLPKRKGTGKDNLSFETEAYITEAEVTENSNLKGLAVGNLDEETEADFSLTGLIRSKRLIHAPNAWTKLKAGDVLLIRAETEELKKFVENTGVRLTGNAELSKEAEGSDEVLAVEVVVSADSNIQDRSAADLHLRDRYGVNLLAVARNDDQLKKRIDRIKFKAGDVLLLQGYASNIEETVADLGCLPLADRGFSIGKPKKISLGLGLFAAAVAAVVTDLLRVEIAFTTAALAMVVTNVLPLRKIYTSIDWPVIVLLGALLPAGTALERSGGADLIADTMLRAGESFPIWATVAALMLTTTALSNVINNAATAVLMAPVALSMASGMDTSPDPFLITVAIGASATFLTPIGHQSNTLVMGPGGYAFKDFFRLGIPMTLLITAASVPLILHFWPV